MRRKYIETLRLYWMRMALAVLMLLPLCIFLSLLWKAWPLLSSSSLYDLLFGSDWSPMQGHFGLWPFISSSMAVSLVSLVLMAPICLGAAIYLTQFAPPWQGKMLKSAIDILAGMPSVIFGLWGIVLIVPLVASWAASMGAANTTGYSMLAAGTVAAVSVMPFVLNMLIELFDSQPIALKEAALSLGASQWQAVKDVLLKQLRPGIVAAFALGTSKAFGETIAVLMVAGNIAKVPGGPFDAVYPLSALLANNYGEMMSIPAYESALMLSALILFVIVVAFNYLAHAIVRKYTIA